MHQLKPSLLITDDDRDFRETLRAVFEPRGFHTLLAADGAEALDILSEQRVHLALFDMHMPRLSGLDAMRRIRRDDSQLPCILLSAALNEDLVAEAHDVAVYRVLAKPVTFADITCAVHDALKANYLWPSSLDPRT